MSPDPSSVAARRRIEGFGRTVQARRRSWEVPGVAVGVLHEDTTLLAEGFGVRRLGRDGLPVTADTVFAICSCTKAFTTMLLGMVCDEGKLDWERPVREYLPELEMFDRFAAERLTTRDLVTHRSGLPRHDYVWYGSSATREQMIGALRHLEPTADLRTTYQYQNLMYMTAGYLVGRLTDSTWEEQLRRRILEPLGMTATSCSLAELASSAHAVPHERSRGRVVRVPYRTLDAVAPAGAINSTVNDLLRWLRFHLDDGRVDGRRLISKRMLGRMYEPHMSIGDGGPHEEFQLASYGLGWTVMAYRGHRIATHGGGIDGYRCRVALLPDDDLGTVVLSNSDTELPHVLTYEAIDRLLGLEPRPWSRRLKTDARREERRRQDRRRRELATRTRGTKPSHRLIDYAGDYHHPGYGMVSIQRKGRGLEVAVNDLAGRLKHFHYDVFELHQRRWPMPFLLTFHTDAQGHVARLSVPLQEGAADIVFTRNEEGAL